MKIYIRFMPFIAFLLMLVGNLDHSLWTPDEPRVAEIAREMAVSGDYLIPHLSGKPFLEKPPLYYAVAGLCYRFWGTSCEGVGRIASVIFGLSTLLVVFWGARKLYNEQIAALSVLILATSYKFYETFHKIEVDNALVLFITVALFSFILAYQKKIASGYYLFWIGLACAFMSKGLIGLAIPITVVVLFAVWQRDFTLLKNIRPVLGILLIIAVMASWGLFLYMKGGSDFLKTFYVYNQFGRFLGGGEYKGGHINPFYYYLPTVLGDALPWSLLFIAALLTTRGLDSTARFFYAWFFGGFILLSMSSTKRGLYFLPMYPALACITGHWMSTINTAALQKWVKVLIKFILAIVLLVAVVFPVAYVVLGGRLWISIVMFLITAAILWLILMRMKTPVLQAIAVCWGIELLLWTPVLMPQIDQLKSYKPLFEDLGEKIGSATVIGYKLTETIEAYSLFYGGFAVDNTDEGEVFAEKLKSGAAQYAIALPKRLKPEQRDLLQERGEKLLEDGGKWREKIELWKLKTAAN